MKKNKLEKEEPLMKSTEEPPVESAEAGPDVMLLADILDQDIRVFIDETRATEERLLSSTDLSPVEREVVTGVSDGLIGEVKKAREDLMERLSELGGGAANEFKELIEGIKSLSVVEMVSNLISDSINKSRWSKGVDFMLTKVPFKNINDLKTEWSKEKATLLARIVAPTFPLDGEGVELIISMMDKQPTSIHELSDIITLSNAAYLLKTKGISLKMLGRISKRSSLGDVDFIELTKNEGSIEKLKFLDNTDLKDSEMVVSPEDIEKLTIKQTEILSGSLDITFLWGDASHINLESVASTISEDNVSLLKDFDKDLEKIKIPEFIHFVDSISKLPKEIMDICKEEYDKGKNLSDIANTNNDLLKKLDAEHISRLKKLIEEHGLSINTPHLKKYLDLSPHGLKRILEMNLSLESGQIGSYEIDTLLGISNLGDEEFDLFKFIHQEFKTSNFENLKTTKRLSSELGATRGKLLMEWMLRSESTGSYEAIMSGDRFIKQFEKISEYIEKETDIELLSFISKAHGPRKLGDSVFGSDWREESANIVERTATDLAESPGRVIEEILNSTDGLINTFKNFKDVQEMLAKKQIEFKDEDLDALFSNLLIESPETLLEENSFPLSVERRISALDTLIEKVPITAVKKFNILEKEYLKYSPDRETTLNRLFDRTIQEDPFTLIKSENFPFSEDQEKYLDIFKKIQESPSREMRILSDEIAPLISKYENPEEAYAVLKNIEQIFLTNNIPLLGKQYKVFEILYPKSRLSASINRSKVESLKSLSNSGQQRLEIFKDLMRSHIASADSNLEQYLLALRDGQEALTKFENGETLDDTQLNKLKLLIKKINILSGHSGRKSVDTKEENTEDQIRSEIESLGSAFGVKDGENIISKFERTFLKRIGIESIDEALQKMEEYRNEAGSRNEEFARDGKIKITEGDLTKNISSDFLDTYLDRGIYAPEFIGAGSSSARSGSLNSDATPFDTDVSRVGDGKSLPEMFRTSFGDLMIVVKDKKQLEKDKLDIFKTGVAGENHYGIRTGFGSTQIDAICVGDQIRDPSKLDQLKFFIARKGFYIPLCDYSGDVVFTKEEFDRYKKIFSGIKRFHGEDIKISGSWKDSPVAKDIQQVAQTPENIKSIESADGKLVDQIKEILKSEEVVINKGESGDSLIGASIENIGSTGRGASLDNNLDFDFTVKLDDNDWPKVSSIIQKLKNVFPVSEKFEMGGMEMFRSKEIEIDGIKTTIDIGFTMKSESEDFDIHSALKEKYDSIKETYGQETLLETLSNIRFAKKKLKEAGCYKAGPIESGFEGGLGGIGVEHWILQNDGNVIEAFKTFKEHAFKDDQLIPFNEFKRSYKIFGSGNGIRGNVKVQNLTGLMRAGGYEKMAELAKEIVG